MSTINPIHDAVVLLERCPPVAPSPHIRFEEFPRPSAEQVAWEFEKYDLASWQKAED